MLNEKQQRTFEEKILCHEKYLFRMAMSLAKNKETAQDILQQTLTKAYEKWGEFELKETSNCKGWVSKILMNEFLNVFRENKHYLNVSLNLNELDNYLSYKRPLVLGKEDRPDQVLASKTFLGDVQKAIDELPDFQKGVMSLYLLENRTYEDIAEMLELSINTVKTRIYRAKKKLQVKLREYKSEG